MKSAKILTRKKILAIRYMPCTNSSTRRLCCCNAFVSVYIVLYTINGGQQCTCMIISRYGWYGVLGVGLYSCWRLSVACPCHCPDSSHSHGPYSLARAAWPDNKLSLHFFFPPLLNVPYHLCSIYLSSVLPPSPPSLPLSLCSFPPSPPFPLPPFVTADHSSQLDRVVCCPLLLPTSHLS